jgi:hypothetical protein
MSAFAGFFIAQAEPQVNRQLRAAGDAYNDHIVCRYINALNSHICHAWRLRRADTAINVARLSQFFTASRCNPLQSTGCAAEITALAASESV